MNQVELGLKPAISTQRLNGLFDGVVIYDDIFNVYTSMGLTVNNEMLNSIRKSLGKYYTVFNINIYTWKLVLAFLTKTNRFSSREYAVKLIFDIYTELFKTTSKTLRADILNACTRMPSFPFINTLMTMHNSSFYIVNNRNQECFRYNNHFNSNTSNAVIFLYYNYELVHLLAIVNHNDF